MAIVDLTDGILLPGEEQATGNSQRLQSWLLGATVAGHPPPMVATSSAGSAAPYPRGATTLDIRPTDSEEEGRYFFSSPVLVPGDRTLFFRGSAPFAVWLVLTNRHAGPLFRLLPGVSGGPGQLVTFERLTFMGGGVWMTGGPHHGPTFRDCNFRCIPNWAIRSEPAGDATTLGPGVKRLRLHRCHFGDCGDPTGPPIQTGAVRMGPADRRWLIDGCVLIRNYGVPLSLHGQDARVVGCSFEQSAGVSVPTVSVRGASGGRVEKPRYTHPVRESWLKMPPYVHILGGDARVVNTRFGSETSVRIPPPYTTVVGPYSALKSPDVPAVENVHFRGCAFTGSAALQGASGEGSVRALRPLGGIRLTAPVSGLRVCGCSANESDNFIVDDSVAGPGQGYEASPQQSYLLDYLEGFSPVSDIFGTTVTLAHDAAPTRPTLGKGFDIGGDRLRQDLLREMPEGRPGGNLLPMFGWLAGPGGPHWKAAPTSEPGLITVAKGEPPPRRTWPELPVTVFNGGKTGTASMTTLPLDVSPFSSDRPAPPSQPAPPGAPSGVALQQWKGPLCFSLWLRASPSPVQAELALLLYPAGVTVDVQGNAMGPDGELLVDAAGQPVAASSLGADISRSFMVGNTWHRYFITAYDIRDAEQVRVRIGRSGGENDKLFMAWPQLEHGPTPTAYSQMTSPTVFPLVRAPRRFQWVGLAMGTVEAGSACPHPVWNYSRGDRMWNTRPTSAPMGQATGTSWRGWICTEGDSVALFGAGKALPSKNATWHPYSRIPGEEG